MELLKSKKTDIVKESVIEAYLVKEIAKVGGKAFKFTSPQNRAVVDRLCVLPKGLVVFVECKRPGGVPTKAQTKHLEWLQGLEHYRTWVDTKQEVDTLMYYIKCELEFRTSDSYTETIVDGFKEQINER